MKRLFKLTIVAGVVAGCATIEPSPRAVDTHATMVDAIDPAAVVIWEINSRAMREASSPGRAGMDQNAWRRLGAAAHRLATGAHRLADAGAIRVGAHNDELEGFVSGAEIQARIDANPEEFRRLARQAAGHAERLVAAANARDIVEAHALTTNLYDNCRACHSRYWEAHAP